MIQKESVLRVIDNSGATKVKCIGLERSPRRGSGNLNRVLRVSIQNIRATQKTRFDLRKGSKMNALLVNVRTFKTRLTGFQFKSDQSDVILLGNIDKRPVATKIRGLLPKELRKSGNSRLLSISLGIL